MGHSLQAGQADPAPAVEAEERPPAPRLVGAVSELVAVGRAWLVAGAVGLAAGVLAGRPGRLTGLEAFGTALVFFLTVGAVLGGLVLGRRSGPQTEYRRILEVAPAPPESAQEEAAGRTAGRGVVAALFTVIGMYVAATVTLAAVLVGLGSPRDQLLEHLPVAAELVAAGWTLICGVVALRVAGWFEYWQRTRGRRVLCRALTAGMMGHYYYAAAAPGAHRDPGESPA